MKQVVLFTSDWDYASFEGLLLDAKQRFKVRLFDYCLMRNHFHFILCPEQDGELSRFMHWLTMTHAKRWNACHEKAGTGAVYQGRFQSIPIQCDHHFLTACRYVERNPLRANLVTDAANWRWSALWRRKTFCERGLLDEWPVPQPAGWDNHVNEPQNEAELAAFREAIGRGAPIGDEKWQKQAARLLHLQPSLRPRGRPPKEETPDAEKTPDPFS